MAVVVINPLTPNGHYRGRTARLTSKRCILCIYSTNIGTEYFKHGIYSPFLSLQNVVCFIMLTYLVPVLFTFYIQGVLNLKEIPAPYVNQSQGKGGYMLLLTLQRLTLPIALSKWYWRNCQILGTNTN
jgi:hypothetical protein